MNRRFALKTALLVIALMLCSGRTVSAYDKDDPEIITNKFPVRR